VPERLASEVSTPTPEEVDELPYAVSVFFRDQFPITAEFFDDSGQLVYGFSIMDGGAFVVPSLFEEYGPTSSRITTSDGVSVWAFPEQEETLVSNVAVDERFL
jgi:hypothetical protein